MSKVMLHKENAFDRQDYHIALCGQPWGYAMPWWHDGNMVWLVELKIMAFYVNIGCTIMFSADF